MQQRCSLFPSSTSFMFKVRVDDDDDDDDNTIVKDDVYPTHLTPNWLTTMMLTEPTMIDNKLFAANTPMMKVWPLSAGKGPRFNLL